MRRNKKVIISPYAFPGIRLVDLPVTYFSIATDVKKEQPLVTSIAILEAIESILGMNAEQIQGKVRSREYAEARTVYCHLARTLLKWSLKEIGASINRDHTTVIHALKNYQDFCNYDIQFKAKAMYIKEEVMRRSSKLSMSLN